MVHDTHRSYKKNNKKKILNAKTIFYFTMHKLVHDFFNIHML